MPLDHEGQPVSDFGVSHVDAATELDSYSKGYLLFCDCQDQSSPNQVYHLGVNCIKHDHIASQYVIQTDEKIKSI